MAYWLPITLLLLALGSLVLMWRVKNPALNLRLSGAVMACTMGAALALQVQTNLRVRAEIRQEAATLVSELREDAPFLARPEDAGEAALLQRNRERQLQSISRNAEELSPWWLLLQSVVLGMALMMIRWGGRGMAAGAEERS